MIIDKNEYERLKTLDGESDLCEVIIDALLEVAQSETVKANAIGLDAKGNEEYEQHYYRALTLKHAIQYVEDWKNSI